MLPALRIELPPVGGLDPKKLFPAVPTTMALEIGFGGGEHLAYQAHNRPDAGFLGVEPYVNGVASLLHHIEERRIANVRIFQDDARLLLNALTDDSLDQAFILFPDPWPKSRHHKRRVINSTTIRGLADKLKSGGELRIATDHPGYLHWIMASLWRVPDFHWLAERPEDWRNRESDWPETRYEKKALIDGRQPVYLRFCRK